MNGKKPLSVDKALTRARSHARRGERDEARGLYLEVLARFPGNRRAMDGLNALDGGGATNVRSPGLTREEFDAVVARLQRGDAAGARDDAMALIVRYPGFPPLLNLAGGIEATLGDHLKAVSLYENALAVDGSFADAHNNLSASFLELRDFAGAESHAQSAIAVTPGNAAAHVNLGNARMSLDKTGEAAGSYRRALELNPANPDAHSNLAPALLKLGKPQDAVRHAREAVRLRPRYPEGYFNLGEALKMLGQLDEAEAAFREALAIRPQYRQAMAGLAATMRKAGRYDEAIALFEETLQLRPDAVHARLHLGELHRDLGRNRQAEDYFHEVLKIAPDESLAYFNLTFMHQTKAGDPIIAEMERSLAGDGHDDEDRITLGFALAKAYEDSGNDDAAFSAYRTANCLRHSKTRNMKAEFDRITEGLRTTFAAAPDPQPKRIVESDQRPVFIVGMPRSGTTLIEQILASHSSVFGGDELQILGPICEPDFARGPVDPARYADPEWLGEVRERYLGALRKVDTDHAVITDKMPFNFMWIGAILLAMPEARIVHLVRDPVAVCWSNYRTRFADANIWFAWDLADLAGYYRGYHELMSFMRERYPGRFLDVEYERLTENPQEEVRRLLDYCDLPWEPACLDFHKTERAVKTASVHQVRQGIYKGSSQSWKRFEKHLRPLIDGLGDLAG